MSPPAPPRAPPPARHHVRAARPERWPRGSTAAAAAAASGRPAPEAGPGGRRPMRRRRQRGRAAGGVASLLGPLLAARAAAALRLEVMVTSRWSQRARRDLQRRAVGACTARIAREEAVGGHEVELLFFMGEPNGTEEAALAELEEAAFRDLVRVGGPDSDPPVPRDVTYVLDRPCARTYRVAHGSAWLAQHRPGLDYVMYLDDDSFIHVPRLLQHLAAQGSESLAMGFTMETRLDWSDTHLCQFCDPCERCQRDDELQRLCGSFPDMAVGGCMMAMQNCMIFNEGQDLGPCLAESRAAVGRLADYFGSRLAPMWLLGMGWVFGRRVVQFIGRNAGRLKVRGAADVALGFWLAPLEGVAFVEMQQGRFHDHPGTHSTFAAECTQESVLVHRLRPEHWNTGFDPDRCELVCNRGQ